MEKQEFFKILEKYELGNSTVEENRLIDDFFESIRQEKTNEKDWNLSKQEEIKLDIYVKMNERISQSRPVSQVIPQRPIYLKIAASLILLITASLLGYYIHIQSKTIDYVTHRTVRGQNTTVSLSDGTKVKLNSESSITFPETFASNNRKVSIEGEAFFEVKRNVESPFIVESEGITTTVLGTSFNVRAYPDESEIEVTVATGRVSVQNIKNDLSQLLVPLDQAVYNKSSQALEKRAVSLDKYLAWKDGIIFLDNVSMFEAAKILERSYDVDFEFESEAIHHCVINGEFRYDTIENLLKNIKFLVGVDYRFKNKNTIVFGGGHCN